MSENMHYANITDKLFNPFLDKSINADLINQLIKTLNLEERIVAIEGYLKNNELYITGFESDPAILKNEGGTVNFNLKLQGSKIDERNDVL